MKYQPKVHYVDELGLPPVCGDPRAYKATIFPKKVTCKHCLDWVIKDDTHEKASN